MTVEGDGDGTETQRLLEPGQPTLNYLSTPSEGAALHRDEESHDTTHGEHFDDVPQEKRQLGTFSAIFIVFNRIIGTGIYATPSNILRSAGSVGVALTMWLVGTFIAATGTAVYMELGTGLPRSGGEKNYLEFIYRRPKFFATCVYSIYGVLANLSAGNSLVFGEYLMHALGLPGSQFNIRTTAILCLTTNVVLHGVFYKLGLRVQNMLGLFKLVFLSAIALTGLLCLAGVPGFQVREGYEKPNNYQWDKFWEGSGTGANAFITGLYNVFWSFVGYNAANYALSETKDPVRTITRAAPIALFSAATVYLLVNVAYFAVVSKSDILGSRQIREFAEAASGRFWSLRHTSGCAPRLSLILDVYQRPRLPLSYWYPRYHYIPSSSMAAQFLASKIALHRSILAMLELKEEWAKDGATGHSGQRVRLEEWGDDIWLQQFRFTQYEVNRLVVALDLPEKVTCPSNGITEDRVTALCMLLRRLAYPIRLADAELFLGWEPSRFSRISTITALYLWHRWKHLLRFDPIRLSPAKLASFGEFVAQKGAPLEDVVAFLDGTLRKMARPVQNQRMVYNGWKRMHCLKFHLLLTPDGIVIHVYGPVEGRRHDETVYQQSGLKDLLRIHFRDEEGRQLFIYGDSGYACKGQVLSPFKGPALTEKQIQWNNAMSKVREPVEWVFGEVIRQFPFLDFSRNQKLLLQPCGLWYLVGILLCNAHTILHQPQTSQYFHCPPPTLEEYFHGEALGDDEMDAWCNSSPWMEMDEEDIDSDSDDTDDR